MPPQTPAALPSTTTRADLVAGLLALLTIGLAIPLLMLFPSDAPLTNGWQTPIIAFELARTMEDLAFLSGAGAQSLRDAMRLGQRVDLFFPFMYGCLLAASLLRFRPTSKRIATAGILLAVLAIPCDLVENRILGHILEALDQGLSTEILLSSLFVATWIKWLSIGFALLCVSALNWPAHKWVALFCALAAPASIAALLTGNPVAGELMSVAVSLGFIAVAVQAMVRAKRHLTQG